VELSIPASGEFSVDLPYEVVRRKVHSSTRPGDENAEIDDMLRATSAI
jgi:hypothetical protein